METNLIYKKIPAIMNEVDAIGKNRKNQGQGYNFRGIDDVYNELHKHFSKHNVFITSKVIRAEREERQTKSGGVNIYSIIDFEFTLFAEDGSNVSTQQRGEAMDSGDKASNKATSAALKYALMQMFLIPTEEDKDTETQSPQVLPKPEAKPKLEQEDLQKTVDYIGKHGKIGKGGVDVRVALQNKYQLTESQLKALNVAVNLYEQNAASNN